MPMDSSRNVVTVDGSQEFAAIRWGTGGGALEHKGPSISTIDPSISMAVLE